MRSIQAVFFTVVNPMDNQDGLGETLCDLSQARIAPYKNTWKHFQDTVFWSNLKLRLTKRTAFHQTRSNAVILYDTLHAEFIEKAMCMKTKDQLYQRESARPRGVLKANSQSGSQDLPVQESRSSWESQQDAESYGETRSNTTDHRILGIPISTVRLQDARRENNVTKLSEMFEKHQHKEQFLEDVSQKQEIIRFSEESQKLFDDMNQTEILELCENSAKLQCPDCNAFSEVGIIYCRRRRCLRKQDSQSTAAIQRFSQDGMHKKGTESHWRSTILAKRKLCFSIASLLKDMTIQLHELNGLYHNWVASRKTRMHWVSQGGKSRGNPMQKVLEPIQRARFTKSTLRHASIQEKKEPSLGKIRVKKSSSAKSPRYEI